MKFYYLLLFLLPFGNIHKALGQNMLQPGNQWIYEVQHWSSLHFAYTDTTIEAITVGTDTVINNVNYTTLSFSNVPCCWNVSNPEYLRNEENKIYRLSRDGQQEFLMIDFEETESYEMLYDMYFGNIDTGIVIIDSFGIELTADNTPIDVQYMHILNNQSYDDETRYTVYKNIGFIWPGLLFPDLGTGLIDFWDGIDIRCFISGEDTIHFTELDCFELPIINSAEESVTNKLQLYPNPTSDILIIPTGLNLMQVFDMEGKRIEPDQVENKIYFNDLPAGLYFLRFISTNTTQIHISRILKL